MAKKDCRTDHDLLTCIEQKVIQHGKDINILRAHFENHLTEHKEDLKEKLRRHWTIVILILSALSTAFGSLIVGIISLFK